MIVDMTLAHQLQIKPGSFKKIRDCSPEVLAFGPVIL